MDGSQSAPYGQACILTKFCRCRRLNKQCQPADSIRKRNGQKNQDIHVRMAQLESKLDLVVSLLQPVTNSHGSSDTLRKLLDQDNVSSQEVPLPDAATVRLTPLFVSAAGESNGGTDLGSSINSPHATSSQSHSSAFTHGPCDVRMGSFSSLFERSVQEAQACLAHFRSYNLSSLPFIDIPPDLTMEQLRQDRPFFACAVIAAASPSVQSKVEYGKELKKLLAHECVVENRSSLDLLLCILTYVAWGSEQFLTKSDTLSRLMMMAISMVCDLGLNKPLPHDEHMIGQFVPDLPCPVRATRVEAGQVSLQEQRATLACFLLSSIVSSYFAQIDAMRWTPQMEEYLRSLAANKHCPIDVTFVYQVRLQLMAQETVRAREQLDLNQHQGTASLPLSLFFSPLQRQLQDLKMTMSSHLPSHKMLMLHAHYVELCISETMHTVNSSAPVFPTSTTGVMGSSAAASGFERLDSLWRSVNAIKSWFDVFFSLSSPACRSLSFPFWAQLARCLVTLIRLSVLEDPSWDCVAVRKMADLRLVLDGMAQKLSCTEGDLQVEDDLFAQFPRMACILGAMFGPKMAPEEQSDQGAAWTDVLGDNMDPGLIMPWMIGVGNDEWLNAFSGGVS
ncbi:hypothetical protein DPV78_007037 [Talaromyces pinophilus]|nr:hypothetical protein DPV78_007037 [Talaromyces pinophilus]